MARTAIDHAGLGPTCDVGLVGLIAMLIVARLVSIVASLVSIVTSLIVGKDLLAREGDTGGKFATIVGLVERTVESREEEDDNLRTHTEEQPEVGSRQVGELEECAKDHD